MKPLVTDHGRLLAPDRLRATVAAQDYDDTERGQLAELADGVEQALRGRWT